MLNSFKNTRRDLPMPGCICKMLFFDVLVVKDIQPHALYTETDRLFCRGCRDRQYHAGLRAREYFAALGLFRHFGLEEVFGIQLFIRHHAQGLSLTAEGQRFLREAKGLLLQAEELQNAATEISSRVAGPLEIGCLSTLFPLAIPELLTVFKKRHEAAKVNAIAGHQTELFESLRSGRISLLLTYDLNMPPDLEFLPLGPLPAYVFVGANHPFARRRSVMLEEMAQDNFILLDLPISRDYFLFVPPGRRESEHYRTLSASRRDP